MFEEHKDGSLCSVDLHVVAHADHGFGVHRLASEKLQVLEFGHQFLHHLLDICLESVNFGSSVMFLKVLDNLLHVALEVIGEGLLVPEACLHQTMVENDINAGHTSLFSSFVKFFGRSVGSSKDNLAFLASFVLSYDLIEDVVLQDDLVGVGEKLVTCENIFEDLHFD